MPNFIDFANATPLNINTGTYSSEELQWLRSQGRSSFASPAGILIGDRTTSTPVYVNAPATNDVKAIPHGWDMPAPIKAFSAPASNTGSAFAIYALTTAGDLYSWGQPTGSLGGGNLRVASDYGYPRILSGGPYKDVTQGSTAAIYLKENGQLWAIGGNAAGRTGLGTSTGTTTVSTRIGTDSDWADVNMGFDNFCIAIKTNGTMWSWGQNFNGKTGLGTTSGDTLVPTQIGTDTNWSRVWAGTAGAFALKTDGSLWGWGTNGTNLILGNNVNTAVITTPTRVGTRNDWKKAVKGSSNAVFLNNDGTIWSTGFTNDFARDGYTGSPSANLTQHAGNNWVNIVSNGLGTMALNSLGEVYYWGSLTDSIFPVSTGKKLVFTGDPAKIVMACSGKQFMIGY